MNAFTIYNKDTVAKKFPSDAMKSDKIANMRIYRRESMIRVATKMKVYPDCYEAYIRRHDKLWPEMKAVLKSHGVHHYSIFLDEETGTLFAYVEIESEAKWAQVAQTEVCQKWWAYMKDLMETNPDNSPKSQGLKEVFYLA